MSELSDHVDGVVEGFEQKLPTLSPEELQRLVASTEGDIKRLRPMAGTGMDIIDEQLKGREAMLSLLSSEVERREENKGSSETPK